MLRPVCFRRNRDLLLQYGEGFRLIACVIAIVALIFHVPSFVARLFFHSKSGQVGGSQKPVETLCRFRPAKSVFSHLINFSYVRSLLFLPALSPSATNTLSRTDKEIRQSCSYNFLVTCFPLLYVNLAFQRPQHKGRYRALSNRDLNNLRQHRLESGSSVFRGGTVCIRRQIG
jgi:hypothetical protein